MAGRWSRVQFHSKETKTLRTPTEYKIVAHDPKVKDSNTALKIESFSKYSMENNSWFSFAS